MLRGTVVVLEFMDPHCTDICPLVSQEFVDAYHDLGRSASNVVFAAVNVNQYYNRVPDVLACCPRPPPLITIPGWHFLTGPAAALHTVWRAYGVAVRGTQPGRRHRAYLGRVLHRSRRHRRVPRRADRVA